MNEPSLYHRAVERLERLRGRPGDTTVGEKTLLALLAYHDAPPARRPDVAVPLPAVRLPRGTLIKGGGGRRFFVVAAFVLALADLDEAVVAYDDALA